MPGPAEDAHPPFGGCPHYRPLQTLVDSLQFDLIYEQSNGGVLLAFIFVSLPFEFFQKRGPHKVGDAKKFMPRCALNFEGLRFRRGLSAALRAQPHRLYYPLALN